MQIRIREKHLKKERCQKNDTEEWNVNGERLQILPYRGSRACRNSTDGGNPAPCSAS